MVIIMLVMILLPRSGNTKPHHRAQFFLSSAWTLRQQQCAVSAALFSSRLIVVVIVINAAHSSLACICLAIPRPSNLGRFLLLHVRALLLSLPQLAVSVPSKVSFQWRLLLALFLSEVNTFFDGCRLRF